MILYFENPKEIPRKHLLEWIKEFNKITTFLKTHFFLYSNNNGLENVFEYFSQLQKGKKTQNRSYYIHRITSQLR